MRLKRMDDAAESFERALQLYPDHAPSNLGLLLVARARGSREHVNRLTRRLHEIQSALEAGRPVRATILGSQILAADARFDDACAALCSLLDAAPPGHAGWTVPIDPFLSEALQQEAFAAVTSKLAERAR
jgi:cytochrome c-type biogenesis protein CcmH/NrfG